MFKAWVLETNTNDRVQAEGEGAEARDEGPEAGAHQVMFELISLWGKAEKAVKDYPVVHPSRGYPRVNPSLNNIGSSKKWKCT